ncbi:MAG TPA: hypothetical protein VG872_08075 [Acidimicrobiia bacterium]|jgi:hypothetical protein|nr:hypothetical protein [Acidimicrobiia bacterium]
MDIGRELRVIEVEPEPIELRPTEEETPIPAPTGDERADSC